MNNVNQFNFNENNVCSNPLILKEYFSKLDKNRVMPLLKIKFCFILKENVTYFDVAVDYFYTSGSFSGCSSPIGIFICKDNITLKNLLLKQMKYTFTILKYNLKSSYKAEVYQTREILSELIKTKKIINSFKTDDDIIDYVEKMNYVPTQLSMF